MSKVKIITLINVIASLILSKLLKAIKRRKYSKLVIDCIST
jgi:hypothetical protein